MSQSGEEFELSLLMSQAEALSYGCHLAKVAGESDVQPDRARALEGLSEDLRRLQQEVHGLLPARIKTAK